MNKLLGTTLLALALSACSTAEKKAEVEDRSTTATPSTAQDNTGGATPTPLPQDNVSGNTLSNDGADPRKVPGSLLGERSVYFDFDSYTVKDSYRPMLEAHAGYLNGKRDARIILQGNTDDRGSREYNLALGQQRAEAVKKTLGVLGVGENQLEAVSFGEEKPRMEGDTEEAWAANRRADFVYADE
jgi:peptidoglycan-associated lipoprotein